MKLVGDMRFSTECSSCKKKCKIGLGTFFLIHDRQGSALRNFRHRVIESQRLNFIKFNLQIQIF